MTEPPVTIVVVPRERFSITRRALESLYANTSGPFRLVYVDGGSPAPIRRYLAAEARARGFELVRTERYLTPNEARNIGFRHVRTRYTVFMDNDVVPARGWLDRLVQCAEETGAWVVGPLYYIGEPEREVIHMAGGDARIEEHPEGRRFVERHRLEGKPRAALQEPLVRAPCEQVEFHCMLIRTEVLGARLGPLDEGLMSIAEHTDICLLARLHGGEVYFEPDSVVTYITTGRFGWSDYAYFLRRWSEGWNAASIEHFREKWGVAAGDPGIVCLDTWSRGHRQIALEPLRRAVVRVCGWRVGQGLRALEVHLNRRLVPVDRARRAADADSAATPTPG